jgi:protoheme IX farnesyltransferase
MGRTRLRPLPQGELTPLAAILIGTLPILAGLVLLAFAGGALPALFGALALVWYLGVYTPLKRRSSLALLAGAVCGALPPVIGWCLAGGRPTDYRVMLLAGVMYLWQVPHFWLFQRRHAADYRNAGFRLLEMADGAGSRLCGLWIAALVAAAMLLPAFGIIGPHAAPWYALFPLPLVLMAFARREQALFSYLNLFPMVVTLALCVPK